MRYRVVVQLEVVIAQAQSEAMVTSVDRRLVTGLAHPAEQLVEGGCGTGLGVMQQMGVGVQGDLSAGVPEPLLDDLDRLASLQQQGRVGVRSSCTVSGGRSWCGCAFR